MLQFAIALLPKKPGFLPDLRVILFPVASE